MAGSLFDIVMKKGQVLTPDRAAKYMRKLTRSVDYLHESNIIHRDIKLENVLIDESQEEINLCDFGLAIVSSVKCDL
jgi:serine/threonine protein kinase